MLYYKINMINKYKIKIKKQLKINKIKFCRIYNIQI